MWQPTHVQVTVQKAKGLLYKGKHETNDCFVVISLGKDKFQTSIKDKATNPVEWREECELSIPSHGNTAALCLTVYHRNALGLDEFLGQIQIPLSDFDVYERPRSRWYRLKGKPDKDKKKGEKERGEIETKVAFTVKSGSLTDVNKMDAKTAKKGGSITSLKHLGGSLMSLGSKEKQSIKSFAKSVSHKIDKIAKPGIRKKSGRKSSRDSQGFPEELGRSKQYHGDADPGVISDSDEDFGFDEEVTLSNTRSSGSPYSTVSRGSSLHQDHHGIIEENETNTSVLSNEHKPPPKPLRIGEVAEVSPHEPSQETPTPPQRRSSNTSTTQPSPLPPISNTLTFDNLNLTPINPNLSSTNTPLNSTNNSSRGGSVTPPTASSPDSALAPSETGSGVGFKDSGSHSSQDEDDTLPPIMLRRNSSRRGIHRSPQKETPKMVPPPRPERPKSPLEKVEPAVVKSNEFTTPSVVIDSSEAPPTSPTSIPTIFIKEATPEPCYKAGSSPDLSEPSQRRNPPPSTPPARPPVPSTVASKTVPQSSPEPAPRAISAPKSVPNSSPANGDVEVFPFEEQSPLPTTPTSTNSTPITPTSAPPHSPFSNFSNNNNQSSITPNTNTTPTSTRGSSVASTPPRVSSVSSASGGIGARPSAAVTRSGSLHEKPTSTPSSPFTSQSPPTDEWGKKALRAQPWHGRKCRKRSL